MSTIKSPTTKRVRQEAKAPSGAVVIPASVALACDGQAMRDLRGLLQAHPSVAADGTLAMDVSDRRTDLLVTLKVLRRADGSLDTSGFDSGDSFAFALDALAKMGLTVRDIGTSHPRFVLRDVRAPGTAVEEPAAPAAEPAPQLEA